ncbi:MAG: endonuclease Q family protein [Candidatus Buchananbacteria bacterium]
MRIVADLHLHSKYSRACSKQLTLENIGLWCQYKGISIIGTSDFTHPAWFNDIKNQLEESEPGLYKLKNSDVPTRFILSTEISCIYKQGGKVRRVHVCILMPTINSVEKIIDNFQKRGFNLKADGRPIIGFSAKELARLVLEIEPRSLVIPAHIWTPWFAVFGSKSGFDSLEECFEDITPYIYAVETGISSDPIMNWRVSMLDDITLLSNSDAHSLNNLGREANVFDISPEKLSYDEIYRIIKEKDKNNFLYTIEFFPEEGRYHVDGHASCKYFANPEESEKNKNICPVCLKPLTLGVLHRINDLCDRKIIPEKIKIPYKNLIPLQEIISEAVSVGKNSKKVLAIYFDAVKKYSEFEILIDLDEKELFKIFDKEVVNAILNVRNGNVLINPGYDGVYGTVKIITNSKKAQQKPLF